MLNTAHRIEQVASIIVNSGVDDISEIARIAKISQRRVVRIIKDLISNAGYSFDERRRAFRGAHIDFVTMKVILKDNAAERGLLGKVKKVADSVLEK